jgi:HK97 family phage prohead protease
MNRENRQLRTAATEFQTREDGEALTIEGYFAVFNSNYDLGMGMSESIAPGAFTDTLADDIRALVNHDTTLVLGRTSAHTLEVRQDEHGLWGKIQINPNDQDAMNLYARVKRGDVSQCSIGFDILDEETEYRGEDVHWTIKAVKLYEVTCCTFPAYEETAIAARSADKAELQKRATEAWRDAMKKRIKGGAPNGTEKLDEG